jgi:hypothetical protein
MRLKEHSQANEHIGFDSIFSMFYSEIHFFFRWQSIAIFSAALFWQVRNRIDYVDF